MMTLHFTDYISPNTSYLHSRRGPSCLFVWAGSRLAHHCRFLPIRGTAITADPGQADLFPYRIILHPEGRDLEGERERERGRERDTQRESKREREIERER